MDTYNIILIKPNDIIFDYRELVNSTPDYFKQFIENFIEIIPVTIDNIMETIINKIGMTSDIFGHTSKCLDTNDHIYQLCHLHETDAKNINDTAQINRLASYMVLGKEALFGPVVLIKSVFIEDRTCIPSNINNIDEFCTLLHERLIHTCIQLNSDGTHEIKKFIESPSEFVSEYDATNYKFIEVNYLNFNFVLFIQMEPDSKNINKKATRLAGEHKILGTAILICKTTENDFLNITLDLYKKIDKTSWGSLKSRDLLAHEKDDNKKINNLDVIINNFNILENRYNQINTVPQNNCICTGCFRMRYPTVEDQKNDWDTHKKECLFEKPDINGYIKTKHIIEQEENITKERIAQEKLEQDKLEQE